MGYIGHCCYNNPRAGVRGCTVYNGGGADDVYNNTNDKTAGDYLDRIFSGGSRNKVAHFDCYHATMREYNSSSTMETIKTVAKDVTKGAIGAGVNKYVTDQIGKRFNK
ncbi:MAG: hypothetical protein VX185_01050 [Pseudomonadota bacterium]|nr:hypothetical protein [Pseudomonadota bacterium]